MTINCQDVFVFSKNNINQLVQSEEFFASVCPFDVYVCQCNSDRNIRR